MLVSILFCFPKITWILDNSGSTILRSRWVRFSEGPTLWSVFLKVFQIPHWWGLAVLSSQDLVPHGPESLFHLFGALWLYISPSLPTNTCGVDLISWGAPGLTFMGSSLGTVARIRFPEGGLLNRSLQLANVFLWGILQDWAARMTVTLGNLNLYLDRGSARKFAQELHKSQGQSCFCQPRNTCPLRWLDFCQIY